MNDPVHTLIMCGLAFAFGTAVGALLRFRRHGNKVVLELEERPVWAKVSKTLLYMVVVVLFLGSVLQSVMFTYEQRECNRQVISSLKERGEAAQQIERVNDQRDAAMRDLIGDILSAQSTPDPGATIRVSLQEHYETTNQLNVQAEQSRQKRVNNPIPRC